MKSSNCQFDIQPAKTEAVPQIMNNKLYSYENRLHQAINKTQQQQQQQQQQPQQQNQPLITLSPTTASSTHPYEMTCMASSQPDLSRDNHLTLYSSQYNLDSNHLGSINNMEQARKVKFKTFLVFVFFKSVFNQFNK